jgi:hypothetical protein
MVNGVGGIDGGRGWAGQDGARNVADAGSSSAQQLIAAKTGVTQSTRAWGPLHTIFQRLVSGLAPNEAGPVD